MNDHAKLPNGEQSPVSCPRCGVGTNRHNGRQFLGCPRPDYSYTQPIVQPRGDGAAGGDQAARALEGKMKIKTTDIVRWGLTFLLVIAIYLETGFFTALFALLVAGEIELRLMVKEE